MTRAALVGWCLRVDFKKSSKIFAVAS